MELLAGRSDRNIIDNLWVQEDSKKVDQVDPKTWTLVGVAPTDVDPWKLQKIRGKRRNLKTKVSFPTKKF
jgi:outer membrane lipoprotein-sorting protein